ncbi:OsmC family protein [Chryseobacterium antibioticum]|uniref:OsmC family protein n=1 Tax=Chryseobacterium pyrolae TaxID=2987481 RepID=A0ABT2ICG6_9FLAO|nr:OsmC family protein [Chryseobacterium pyrolae]MCT2406073.1 OsmC family protein [Chryseobacterium pyrolae]
MLNNVNLEALGNYVEVITNKPTEAIAALGVTATWKGGVNTEITTHSKKIGSVSVEKQFKYNIGEPAELLGDNLNPNPQDYILGGLAGCMMVGFVVGATSKGIKLDSVNLTIVGNLDLRGFLEVDPSATVGFEELEFNFEVTGSGTEDDYAAIAEHVRKISPGYRTIAEPVKISVNKSLKAIV